MKTASEEMKQASRFNCQVVNRQDNLDQAVADIDAAITAEKRRPGRAPVRHL